MLLPAAGAVAETITPSDPSATATLQPGSTTPVDAEQWAVNPQSSSPSPVTVSPDADAGVCKGSFTAVTSVPAEHEFQWGSQLQCTESVAARTGIEIQYCTRDGGPDNFDCNVVDNAVNRGTYSAGAYHVAHTYAKCRGTAHFRPIAFNIEVAGVDFPEVVGNVNTITCTAG